MKQAVSLGLIIVILICISVPTIGLAEVELTDIKGHWAEDYITRLAGMEILNGFPDKTFRPHDKITVDQFIKVIIESMGHTVEKDPEYWAKRYIEKALEEGIIKTGDFDSYQRDITREEMAYITVNAVLKEEYKPSVNHIEYVKMALNDYWEISDKYKQQALESYALGLVCGKPGGIFDPQGTATRAEASTIAIRFLKPSERRPYSPPEDVGRTQIMDNKGYMTTFYAPYKEGRVHNELKDLAEAIVKTSKEQDQEAEEKLAEVAAFAEEVKKEMESKEFALDAEKELYLLSKTDPKVEEANKSLTKGYVRWGYSSETGGLGVSCYDPPEIEYFVESHGINTYEYDLAGAEFKNLAIETQTHDWTIKEGYLLQPMVRISVYKPQKVRQYNMDIVNEVLEVLFEDDYEDALQLFNDYVDFKKYGNYKEYNLNGRDIGVSGDGDKFEMYIQSK